MISARTKLCMVIGDPIAHSLSPEMHNAAYKELGIDDSFVYVASQIKTPTIKDFVTSIRVLSIRGVSCTIPHKTLVMPYLDEIDETARKIGAVNTIVNDNGRLMGYNTDWLGVVTPLENLTSINGKKVAILGAGGAARAAIYGLTQKGGIVTIFNRTFDRAQGLAEEFGCSARGLDDLKEVAAMDIVFNATAAGMHPHHDETPIAQEYLRSNQIVFDAVYNPLETRLLQEAQSLGAQTIPGYEMLLYQGTAQFKLYTGHEAPVAIMRETLLTRLKGEKP